MYASPKSTITLTFTKEEFFLLTESLRTVQSAMARHPEATIETREVREEIIRLGGRMLDKAREENTDW